MAANEDKYLTSVQHRYLAELADAPDLEDIWKRIEKSCGKQPLLKMRWFIREIVRARSIADFAEIWPDYRGNAKIAERLVRFIEGSGQLPPPLPDFLDPVFLSKLKDLAARLRQTGRIHISRERKNSMRQRLICTQMLSLIMQENFNYWFDDEVAYFTNVFFPNATVTGESVREARRRSRIRPAA